MTSGGHRRRHSSGGIAFAPEGIVDTTRIFDMRHLNDNATFEGGTWSNFPYYSSRSVVVSSMDRGLFVLRPKGNL